MAVCAICLAPDPDAGHYHRACLVDLFGVDELPALDLDLATLPARVQATEERTLRAIRHRLLRDPPPRGRGDHRAFSAPRSRSTDARCPSYTSLSKIARVRSSSGIDQTLKARPQ